MNQLTDDGIVLIKSFESLRLKAYDDATGKTLLPNEKPKGTATIGYGHVEGVRAGDECSVQQAENWLARDIAEKAEVPLRQALGGIKCNDNQYSALVSLVFNTGPAPLHATLGSYLKAGNMDGVAQEFTKWIYSHGKVMPGLLRRREAEKKMFLTPTGE